MESQDQYQRTQYADADTTHYEIDRLLQFGAAVPKIQDLKSVLSIVFGEGSLP